MKKKYKKCSYCGKKSKDVKFRINPYGKDVFDESRYSNICDKCYGELCDAI